MTAHVMDGDEQRCLAAGMDGYLSKPIRAEQLVAMMDRVLSSDVCRNEQLDDATVTVAKP